MTRHGDLYTLERSVDGENWEHLTEYELNAAGLHIGPPRHCDITAIGESLMMREKITVNIARDASLERALAAGPVDFSSYLPDQWSEIQLAHLANPRFIL